MTTIDSPCGPIPVSGPVEYYETGALKSCTPAGEVTLNTSAGSLIPQYTSDDLRRREVPRLEFHPNGQVASISLENRTDVQTPGGALEAEMLTFYPEGEVKRVFPLNGKLSGYWTQDDEAGLAEPLSLLTSVGPVSARLISLLFGRQGHLAGLTFWPGEVVNLDADGGTLPVRIGIRFRDDGSVQSLEPEKPVTVGTPVGPVRAYDPDAIGINGDENSLHFTPEGDVLALRTVHTALVVQRDGEEVVFAPTLRDSHCGDEETEPVPLGLRFDPEGVYVRLDPEGPEEFVAYQGAEIDTRAHLPQLSMGIKAGCGI